VNVSILTNKIGRLRLEFLLLRSSKECLLSEVDVAVRDRKLGRQELIC